MDIPKQAKKVFGGIIYDVYHWEQEMFDGTFETFEMLRRGPTADVIAWVGDTIIILEQEQPNKPLYPGLPGGRMEPLEEPLEAAKRELLEETGYASEDFTFVGEYNPPGKIDMRDYLFIAKNCRLTDTQHLDAGEKISVTLVTFEAFLQYCRNPRFTAPLELRFEMYEALLDPEKKASLKKKLGG